MTPKERAEKLHMKFYCMLPNNGSYTGIVSIPVRWREGIECAIAAVNIIKDTLNESESIFGVDFELDYWDQVLEELNKRLENENNR